MSVPLLHPKFSLSDLSESTVSRSARTGTLTASRTYGAGRHTVCFARRQMRKRWHHVDRLQVRPACVSFTGVPKDGQQCGQIGLSSYLLGEPGIRLDPLLLCHDRWVRETGAENGCTSPSSLPLANLKIQGLRKEARLPLLER
jgi:hypothetical protein